VIKFGNEDNDAFFPRWYNQLAAPGVYGHSLTATKGRVAEWLKAADSKLKKAPDSPH
jgi:hypothetical protein